MTSDDLETTWPTAASVRSMWRSSFKSRVVAEAETELNRAAIDAVFRALENVQEFVSPQMARSIQAQINLTREIGRNYGLLSEFTVRDGLDLDSGVDLPRMFGVTYCGEKLYPGFLFEPSPDKPGKQRVKPFVDELAKLADEFDWDEESITHWLVAPTGYLPPGDLPVDHLDEVDLVLTIFKSHAGVQW